MMEGYSSSIFQTFNARHISSREVPRTFVPPIAKFKQLTSRNNHLLVGPRGSGKTTLLKMLTVPALANWREVAGQSGLGPVGFYGIFVAADRSWQVQWLPNSRRGGVGTVASAGEPAYATPHLGHKAFTTHVLLSLVQTLRDLAELQGQRISALDQVPPLLSRAQEQEIVRQLASVWELRPPIGTYGGLAISLRARLAGLGKLRQESEISQDITAIQNIPNLDFRACLSHAFELFDVVTDKGPHVWALMFDEVEIAPNTIQQEILHYLRGDAEHRLINKIAMAPYNKNYAEERMEDPATLAQDFQVVNLSYPQKWEAKEFSAKLVQRMLEREGVTSANLPSILTQSGHVFQDEETVGPYQPDGVMRRVVENLARQDPAFAKFLSDKKIDLSKWNEMSEQKRAEFRKARSTIVAREYYLRQSVKGPHDTSGRSRKINPLYTGFPALLELCEGNPRMIIGIFTPLIQRLAAENSTGGTVRIKKHIQAARVQDTVNAFRSLLKTIPYDPPGQSLASNNRGLLQLTDKLGAHFFNSIIQGKFDPEPERTFVVDSFYGEEFLRSLGRAVNAGAVVYVPDRHSTSIMGSLRGKRFRLSYLLAAYYRIPMTLGRPVALSRVLGTENKRMQQHADRLQGSLFGV